MSKPDWKDAPEWAKYLAMDDTGEWYWFELEPYYCISTHCWYEDSLHGRVSQANLPESAGQETLERRP